MSRLLAFRRSLWRSSHGLQLQHRSASTLNFNLASSVPAGRVLRQLATPFKQWIPLGLALSQVRGGSALAGARYFSASAASDEAKTEHFRADYKPSPYVVKEIDLDFNLDEKSTTVTALNRFIRNPRSTETNAGLSLDGEELELVTVYVNDKQLSLDLGEYQVVGDRLNIPFLSLAPFADEFTLKTVVRISPQKNLALSGLYKSGSPESGELLCTQCEAMGYRRITYSLDRPDVLSVYRVRLEAERSKYPILLSNGNLLEQKEVPTAPSRHYAVWEDPFPKPSYLFAIVAGDLASIKDQYVTTSGRVVQLGIYSDKENADKLDHAMYSLKESMSWDEQTFGLECDLDVYNIVATNDFNMGAMENKGLNIFNTAYVLADARTATDVDYERILGVIAHEYFHNWSGNRVTVRDWFQLTLKEGLTVFRDQWFSADKTSASVKRIEDVKALRGRQFGEDSSPMAHPIRPESYISMDNFYTATVYSKGAEVIGIYRRLLGTEGFKKGLALYFKRFDGQAVTCDDFRQAMADANNVDLSCMDRWYSQAGTPEVTVSPVVFDAVRGTFSFTASQRTPDTPGQTSDQKLPVPIPLESGLIDAASGEEVAPSETFVLTETEQTFHFAPVAAADRDRKVVLSTLRDFSAPVTLIVREQSEDDLVTLMAHDTDPFNQWDASQRYYTTLVTKLVDEFRCAHSSSASSVSEEQVCPARTSQLPSTFLHAIRTLLSSAKVSAQAAMTGAPSKDLSLLAYALSLPDETTMLTQMTPVIDIDALHWARQQVKQTLATNFAAEWQELYDMLTPAKSTGYVFSPAEVGRRKLRNVALEYVTLAHPSSDLASRQLHESLGECMTDALAAIHCVVQAGSAQSDNRQRALQAFYDMATAPVKNALVLNKWFAIQALADDATVLDDMKTLMQHPDFIISNPNRARSLLSTFSSLNLNHLHRADGAGYTFMEDAIVSLDKINPQVAARMLSCFSLWKKFDPARKELMGAALRRIQATEGLSPDSFEVVSRYLK